MLFGADISIADKAGDSPLHLLTKLVVANPSHSSRYLEIFDSILDKAPTVSE